MASRATPREAPICWPTVTTAEARPTWGPGTPRVPVLMAAGMMHPMPIPSTMIPGTTAPAYVEVVSIRDSIRKAAPSMAMPRGSTTRVPRRRSRYWPASGAVTTRAPIMGRKAMPVRRGE